MNFFQSVFSDDPEPESESPNLTSAWSLLKTLASKSESVIETYRRDLHDFTSGIKSESAVIRQVAVNTVKNLPNTFETGAGIAQESLESVGQVIDNLAGIIAGEYSDSDSEKVLRLDSKPYSRVEEKIRTAKCDMNTYLIDPEDLDEFNDWKLSFKCDEKRAEIKEVMNESDGAVCEIFKEIVPERVDEEVFWMRFFYKVERIRKAEEARLKLVKRAICEDDEELSWDVDEDDEKASVSETKNVNEVENVEVDKDSDISIVSSQPSPEEDGWDEIEDIASADESKVKTLSRGSPDRVELRKRLSVADEDEEDLTWDIEDDVEDENVKA